MTPCSVVVGYQRFGGPCCHHLQAGRSAETLVSYITPRCHNSEDFDAKIRRRKNLKSRNMSSINTHKTYTKIYCFNWQLF
jgi:hypothetical protein